MLSSEEKRTRHAKQERERRARLGDAYKVSERARSKRRREENPERIRAQQREAQRRYRERHKEAFRKKTSTPESRSKHAEYMRGYRARNPKPVRSKNSIRKQYKKTPEQRLRSVQRYHDDPLFRERVRETSRKNHLRRRYGLTVEQREELFEVQGRRCALCGSEKPRRGRWAVDHCHTTGVVRGIVCTPCNALLGMAEDDCIILRKAARYLAMARTRTKLL